MKEHLHRWVTLTINVVVLIVTVVWAVGQFRTELAVLRVQLLQLDGTMKDIKLDSRDLDEIVRDNSSRIATLEALIEEKP